MKKIEILEQLKEEGKRYNEIGVNPTFGEAYFYSMEAGNDLINFAEVIWNTDIDEIVRDCKRFGIEEFTISSTFSSLIETLAELQKRGMKVGAVYEVNSRYDDWRSDGERVKRRIPALRMSFAE